MAHAGFEPATSSLGELRGIHLIGQNGQKQHYIWGIFDYFVLLVNLVCCPDVARGGGGVTICMTFFIFLYPAPPVSLIPRGALSFPAVISQVCVDSAP